LFVCQNNYKQINKVFLLMFCNSIQQSFSKPPRIILKPKFLFIRVRTSSGEGLLVPAVHDTSTQAHSITEGTTLIADGRGETTSQFPYVIQHNKEQSNVKQPSGEDGSKRNIHVDDGADNGARPNTNKESPVQPAPEKTDSARSNDDRKDHGQFTEEETSVLTSTNKQGNMSGSDTSNTPAKDLQRSITPAEKGGQATKIDTPTESGGKDATTTKIDTAQCGDNKTTQGTLKPGDPCNSSRKPDSEMACVTVIFHALLTPTFSINFKQGEKVVLRGNSPFSWHAGKGKQVEIRVVRYILSYYIIHCSHYLSFHWLRAYS